MHADDVAQLSRAFPAAIQADARAALEALPDVTFGTSEPIGQVSVRGEALIIPHRIHLPWPEAKALRGTQATIAACLYTRNGDGRVREEFVRRLLPSTEPWVPPFVVQLIGEYVVEIVEVVAEQRDRLAGSAYVEFAAENPRFMALTRQRVISYWSCYYRRRWPGLADYAPLQLVDSLLEAARRWEALTSPDRQR